MYTIKTMNAISPVGLAKLPANQFEINNEADDAQGILVRSADLHDVALPKACWPLPAQVPAPTTFPLTSAPSRAS